MGFSSPFCPSSRISLRKKSRAILVGRGKGNVASVRFARRRAKAKGEKNERRWMDGGPVSRIVDELISTRMAVQRRFFAVCRGKLDSNWQSLNLYPSSALLAILPSIFETDFDFSFRESNFLILSPISFDPTIARCFQTCFERQVVREKGEFK